MGNKKSFEHTVRGVEVATNIPRNNFLPGDRGEDMHAFICMFIPREGWEGGEGGVLLLKETYMFKETYMKLLIATLLLMLKNGTI